jgi:hypothetical protein
MNRYLALCRDTGGALHKVIVSASEASVAIDKAKRQCWPAIVTVTSLTCIDCPRMVCGGEASYTRMDASPCTLILRKDRA